MLLILPKVFISLLFREPKVANLSVVVNKNSHQASQRSFQILKTACHSSLPWCPMVWGVLPVLDILVFISGIFRPIFPTASDKFERKLTQLAKIVSSFRPTMTGAINKFIQK